MLCCCSTSQQNQHTEQTCDSTIDSVKYAHGFRFTCHDAYRELTILEPYKEGVLAKYYLVSDSQIATPDDGVKLVVPLQRIGTASSTHIGFMEALGLLDHISGVCLPNTIYSPTMRQLYEHGGIIDLGDAMQINPERALLAQADAIMISGYGQGDVNPERLNAVGINVIYNNEWTERSPLGRAEWIKVVAALFCKDQLADSIFNNIESEYKQYRKVGMHQDKPSVMSGNNFRGTWYMSSGDSYMGRLFADAGAEYYFQNDSTQGSIPLSIETVIKNFGNADVWVGSNGHSLNELASADKKHTWFKAFQTGRVYNFYRRQTETGANDYWERGVVHPEELLKDMIWALYPDEMTDYQPIYINQLQ